MKIASHPPRPGARRIIMRQQLNTPEGRREFMTAVRTISLLGFIADITVEDGFSEPMFTLHGTRVVLKGENNIEKVKQ